MKLSKSARKKLLILGAILLGIAAIIVSLPAPISMDLSQIGNVKTSVVFIYDINIIESNQQSAEMNKAKETIGDNANFLIARTGYPETASLMERYDAQIAQLLFFDENGQLRTRKFAVIPANQLIDTLKSGNN